MGSNEKFNICMCCDFFYPRLGGVEMHIFSLSLELIRLGHKVIIVTNTYGDRQGVRYITNGLKVYYTPMAPFTDQAIFPSIWSFLPLFRKILIREKIQIVHAHQTTSILGQECILHSRTMGYKTVFTDHSLFGFSDAACIHVNKLMKLFLSDIDHAISVSHTSKENLTLRASFNPSMISVIPNSVDCSRFKPDPSKRYPLNTINVVCIQRLTFRKGVDLLISIIPEICKKVPEIYFIIGGDGPKRGPLEEMIKRENLQNRVELLGSVQHTEVRNILVRGHIFLNCSLTEAFCIAIVEAASSGLLIVSTNVGGIVEVLPEHMVHLANPNPEELTLKLLEAIPNAKNVPAQQFHNQVSEMYNWMMVAKRNEKVYQKIMKLPRLTLRERFQRYYSSGPFAGILILLIVVFDLIFFAFCSWFEQKQDIDIAIDFPNQKYIENKEKYGDHQFSVLN
ncbi:hypothetical protein IMG5_019260 [Ichthyophthirius multifiliis]|uniref:phosphatidylinositol N-acetylglucosaminyltransferase n=1 Tax=Ichthyophthirius multifiliis TaxID=5932 RepID=G0QKL0_ICHMU|nr:hypothetical protein IMG5_019260 [Ichthyophthirius multifiliis]EGR34242.1 hypothetical protein IMG5_019260 [Ichthyophthirius multifiliis]|eukprot:XP_004039546.1 hypothetical protein IMG5_019260 [Ichthyophthirius multifiliis]